jgi:general secretion pathway protein I
MKAARGFTLIEVLVALAIVAIGMAAVLEALTSSANTAAFLQDKTFADWVALNRLETLRLSGNFPATGSSSDHVDYAGQSWQWQQKVTTTQIPDVREIEVDVRPADSTAGEDRGWYATATGFVGKDFAPANAPEPAWSTPNPVGTSQTPGAGGTPQQGGNPNTQ